MTATRTRHDSPHAPRRRGERELEVLRSNAEVRQLAREAARDPTDPLPALALADRLDELGATALARRIRHAAEAASLLVNTLRSLDYRGMSPSWPWVLPLVDRFDDFPFDVAVVTSKDTAKVPTPMIRCSVLTPVLRGSVLRMG